MPIVIRRLGHMYLPRTPMAKQALHDINLEVHQGELLGIIGPAQAGKSTLVQYLGGLWQPAPGAGTVEIHGRVGVVFQHPEDQLFEQTVASDVAFGPRQEGLPDAEVQIRVERALGLVGLPSAQFGRRNPWQLSGGYKRRVAIAGILALEPSILIFDEPVSGLDPRTREHLLALIRRLHHEEGITVIVVSNDLEVVARLAQRVVVMHQGKIEMIGPTRQVFGRGAELARLNLPVLPTVALMEAIRDSGLAVDTECLTVDEICDEIARTVERCHG